MSPERVGVTVERVAALARRSALTLTFLSAALAGEAGFASDCTI